ncbi:MAG: tRNA (guanine-N1)-methyltransferase [Flavobacteriaceae bacterium]|nr:tRNA (guanine-N1)-methyltransferase [Flavobacteriaceae bacterium]
MKFIFFVSLLIFLSFETYAQETKDETPKRSLNSGTIESQFDYLYKKSGSYQEYKVVKKVFYHKIKGNVLDSLKSLKKDLIMTKQTVETQASEISNLKTNLKTTNDNLTKVSKEKDNIKFLGISMTKGAYNTILWSIIIGLMALLAFFVFKFKASNTITKQSNELLTETEEEFDQYKAVALEREQKVRRELQDELNKQKYNSKGKKEK